AEGLVPAFLGAVQRRAPSHGPCHLRRGAWILDLGVPRDRTRASTRRGLAPHLVGPRRSPRGRGEFLHGRMETEVSAAERAFILGGREPVAGSHVGFRAFESPTLP